MPKLSWNEIHQRAVVFARDWGGASREQSDKQTFWNEFFDVFGLSRRLVASFEEPVRRLRGSHGFIDLLWKGKVLVEHKSAGASLEAAETQAFDYLIDMQAEGRGDELPRYILLSDFRRFALYDLEPEEQLDLPLFRNRRFQRTEFFLTEFPEHIREFAWIPGYQVSTSKPQDPLNLKATEIMGRVHDALAANGYEGHDLGRLLVRLLFCFFAEDTHIFEPELFRLYIENRTAADGSDLGVKLDALFRTLDTPVQRRQRNLDESLKEFPYVNGELFRERLEFAAFDKPMRDALLAASAFDWSRISPAIFGGLFQEVIKERRKIGAHYTSERDILKVIEPLFLDGLRAEFEAIEKDRSGRRSGRLEGFRKKLRNLKFLDPACGCGNFLVIAYRELRALELRVLVAQHGGQQALTLDEVNGLSQVDVDQFYGIEIQEWPARIAEVALWLTDHQANLRILEAFGQSYDRLPLTHSPHIRVDNALRMDWNDLLPAAECSFVFGNPPFIGKSYMSASQREDRTVCFERIGGVRNGGLLDYVACWYVVAAEYIAGHTTPVAFVSTNSLSQGEQPGVLWSALLHKFKISIHFAYRTFAWTSEARGKAHVHVVIIGFSGVDRPKQLFDTDTNGKLIASEPSNISPYLVDAPSVTIVARSKPICQVPSGRYGSKPVDNGALIISDVERSSVLLAEPSLKPYIRRLLGSKEFLSDKPRWCFWLDGASPDIIFNSKILSDRINRVREFRLSSKKGPTRQASDYPSLFAEIRQPNVPYLAIPEVSSQRRKYIPINFCDADTICTNKMQMFPDATMYHFGVLTSTMHMAWMRQVCGRLKSDFSYSTSLVYNNFPWPQRMTKRQKANIELLAQSVLDVRLRYYQLSLSQLYLPTKMGALLTKAHAALDRAVERCYRVEVFGSDRERVEFLFRLYEELTAPLLPVERVRRRRRQDKAV